MLGCSRRTLYTLRQRLGVTKKDFTDISDNDLNEVGLSTSFGCTY